MMTKTSASAQTEASLSFLCPSCLQATALQSESCRIGAEILCRECYALLRILSKNPLLLEEIEEEDLFSL